MLEQIKQDYYKGNLKEEQFLYLIGEVERLQHERDNALSLRNVSVKHFNSINDQNKELQKVLEDQKLRMQDGHKNGYESETIFWTRCIWEIDQVLKEDKPNEHHKPML